MIEYSHPTTGWRAECQSCPSVVEPDYGARVFPNADFPDTDEGLAAAERWTDEHWAAHPGHDPKVTQFWRWTMTSVEHLDVRLMEALFKPAEPFYSALDELRDTVYWARNVAWSELGIEPPPARPLAITSRWKRTGIGDPTRDTSSWTFPTLRTALPVDMFYGLPPGFHDVGRLGPEGIT